MTKHVYLVFRNADMTEGRGPMLFHAAFAALSDASAYADLQPGVMGMRGPWGANNGGHWEVREARVFQSLKEATAIEEEALRASALRKLSREERRALGLE